MFLEPINGVVVSDGYADYLDISLAYNRELFHHCAVVTTSGDRDSQRVAGKYDCTLVITDEGRRDGKLHKGMMVERGLQQLPQDGWRCHWDADIVFPGDVRRRLGSALYDREALYGCDRMNIVGWEAWQKLLATGWASRGFEYHHFLAYSIARAEVGGRLIYGEYGWCPIGYMQMWNAQVEYSDLYRTRPYATGSNSAAHDDTQFALRWDRKKRILIPEFYVAHLVTDDSSYGKNWKGRVTKRFGPEPYRATGMPGSAPSGPPTTPGSP